MCMLFTENIDDFIARKRSLGQGNVFTPVCHSVRRGVSQHVIDGGVHPVDRHLLGRHPLGRHPSGRHPLGRQPPSRQTLPPPGQTTPICADTPSPSRWQLKQAVRILLEYFLVQKIFSMYHSIHGKIITKLFVALAQWPNLIRSILLPHMFQWK